MENITDRSYQIVEAELKNYKKHGQIIEDFNYDPKLEAVSTKQVALRLFKDEGKLPVYEFDLGPGNGVAAFSQLLEEAGLKEKLDYAIFPLGMGEVGGLVTEQALKKYGAMQPQKQNQK